MQHRNILIDFHGVLCNNRHKVHIQSLKYLHIIFYSFFTFYIYYIIFFIKSQIFSFSKKNWKGTNFFIFKCLFPFLFLFLYGFIISKNFEFVKYSLPLSKFSIFFSEPCIFALKVDYLFISHRTNFINLFIHIS